MRQTEPAERLFRKTLALAAGFEAGCPALAGISFSSEAGGTEAEICDVFRTLAAGRECRLSSDRKILEESCLAAREAFLSWYIRHADRAVEQLARLEAAEGPEEKARLVSETWAPEIAMKDEEILRRWRLTDVLPNPRPIEPTEVVIQLNALYTLPDPQDPTEGPLAEAWKTIRRNPGPRVADYDHPVPLFTTDHHELIECLDELDADMEFEKEKLVLPRNYRVPVLVSVSVTHPSIDELTGQWILGLLGERSYRHIQTILLTEKTCRHLMNSLFGSDMLFFTVLGTYGAHFNALKYTQLLLEGSHGIRAGFKLDTDEGIHSRDLFKTTGKTWLQTLCHPYWGGTAKDWKGRKVLLGVNEGEYVNEKDLHQFGYAGAFRRPDVMMPASFQGPDIFFLKAMAHGRATELYNRFEHLTDWISHPVVKGGGYGITNEALRKAVPFTLSMVGRAEDQQFYFSGLSRGVRGIFHPDLRIIHYKDRVGKSEKRTELTRFAGDMFRLVLFGHLASILKVKEDIDPMPGVFASPLAPAQSFFHILAKSCSLAKEGREEDARSLLETAPASLASLQRDIENGSVGRLLVQEEENWRSFIKDASRLSAAEVRRVFHGMSV